MTTLNFNSAETVPPVDFDALGNTNNRNANWVRFYAPAMVIVGSLLYVVHAWMGVA